MKISRNGARFRAFARKLRERAAHCRVKPAGIVHLVGAGPGNPDLLTVRAAQLIQGADVLVYDQLVGPEILRLARRDAQRIFVGKRAGRHSIGQDAIHRILLEQAQAGRCVVRLKGGDPGMFGRAGEEVVFLRAHGVPVRIVPGVTAALGCAAAAGIPLTHRGMARALHIATGHACGGTDLDLDWGALADLDGTLVFYMGRKSLPKLACKLGQAGLPPDTPAMLIENGTLPDERRRFATLNTLAKAARDLGDGPTLVILGRVVSLAEGFVPEGPVHAQVSPRFPSAA